ncbi:thioredoxin domain-containing protein [Conexibacter sp. SYSU D00693]|uniref:thioredoxin domain-containing protein n=1 Tax=Conexibacter sp. SYSU D00693 TaxID=2812560 RepID=UPI00196AB64B|nr:thioredoxin domain-containing protein [Conexibacter sp. SYSU D00693]
MPNALAHETSPYLLQHAGNPVDWLPWGEEALRRAREEDRPLLVSIGYSSCHWCHVMERESFEDPEVAALMNARFVCVKVDREERPDVDALHMDAVQAMRGGGGWPLNVFVTPERIPFYGGTYFPPTPAEGMPSWTQVLEAVAKAWDEQREEIRTQGARMQDRLAATSRLLPSSQPVGADAVEEARRALGTLADRDWGGFGGAPKFPPSSVLHWLLERGDEELAVPTLHAMRTGGIHDQVGGGFARYATDRTWTVPHFEKMLYDNALLLRAYVMGFQRTGDARLARTADELVGWLEREMRQPDGGWASALDADSEGVEGRFYVWRAAELREALGPQDAEAAVAWLGVTEGGNFVDPHHPAAGLNVLTGRGPEPPAEQRERIRCALLAARGQRTRPGLDDKRITSWNALTVGALAHGGAVLGRPAWLDAARAGAEFLLSCLRDAGGGVHRTFNRGQARLDGVLEDHAFLVEALLDLYEATFETRWFAAARGLADVLLDRFHDPVAGGFFMTAEGATDLVVRRRDLEDHPIPSGSSSAALGLLRLAALTGDRAFRDPAVSHLRLVHELAGQHPQAFAHTLRAIAFHTGPAREVALAGDPEGVAALAAVVREQPRPALVLAGPPGDGIALMAQRGPVGGQAAAYVCEGFSCRAPVTSADELRAALV